MEFDACALECGPYEASDMLLGDHLCDKSCTVEWLDVSMPHARQRLKDHKQLKELEELDPGSENVFMDNLVGNHYPDRPHNLEGCVSMTLWQSTLQVAKIKVDTKRTGSFKSLGL